MENSISGPSPLIWPVTMRLVLVALLSCLAAPVSAKIRVPESKAGIGLGFVSVVSRPTGALLSSGDRWPGLDIRRGNRRTMLRSRL